MSQYQLQIMMDENEYIIESMISELELHEVVYNFIKFNSASGKIDLCWTGILHIRMWFITLYDNWKHSLKMKWARWLPICTWWIIIKSFIIKRIWNPSVQNRPEVLYKQNQSRPRFLGWAYSLSNPILTFMIEVANTNVSFCSTRNNTCSNVIIISNHFCSKTAGEGLLICVFRQNMCNI